MIKTYRKDIVVIDQGVTTGVKTLDGEIFIEFHDKEPGELVTYDGGVGVIVSVLPESVTVLWTKRPFCDLEMKTETIKTTSRKLKFTWSVDNVEGGTFTSTVDTTMGNK